jgi:hypothetical protein
LACAKDRVLVWRSLSPAYTLTSQTITSNPGAASHPSIGEYCLEGLLPMSR